MLVGYSKVGSGPGLNESFLITDLLHYFTPLHVIIMIFVNLHQQMMQVGIEFLDLLVLYFVGLWLCLCSCEEDAALCSCRLVYKFERTGVDR